jgi:hypothetical protein
LFYDGKIIVDVDSLFHSFFIDINNMSISVQSLRIRDKRPITVSPGVVRDNGPAFLEFEIEYFPYKAGLELNHEAPFTYFPLREGVLSLAINARQ